jgi:hypothetical protein
MSIWIIAACDDAVFLLFGEHRGANESDIFVKKVKKVASRS